MIDQINLFTSDASIRYSIILNIILLAAIVILSLVFYLIARKRKHERLVKEKQLDTQQKFARELLDSVPAGFILLAPNGSIKQVNHQAAAELGIQKQDIKNKNIREVFSISHENINILDELLGRLQKDEQEVTLPPDTFIYGTINTTSFLAKGYFKNVIVEKGSNCIIFTFRNVVTELTQEYVLNMALRRTKIFPWSYDTKCNLMTIDPRYFEHLDIPAGDCTLTNEQFAQLVHPDDIAGVLEALTLQVQGNFIEDPVSYRLHRGDGKWEWFEAQSSYLGQGTQIPFRLVGVCMSTQEHKKIEEELTKARDKAQQSDKLKSAFLANMSHEIRTPLNAIVGFSNLLVDGDMAFKKEEIKEFLSLIHLNCEQLLALISDILDLSKIESNTMVFNITEQPLTPLLQNILRAQQINVPQEVELLLDLPATDTIITTDPLRLKQVINNLINNAIKFTSKGTVTLGYKQNNDQVSIFVKDTGTGIDEDKMNRIFERFYKGDNFVQGTGLGLAISHTIIEHLKGTITVTSKVGEGSCFTIQHPVKKMGY
ncbi:MULTISPECIES: ATP-binding protein [Butyricimonas]|uniref:PAS domain-containing sensor histidine kinase n=1 Tax=Butyricimonas TaxID=574697 RepID=UPI00207D8836|nr:ATP-binding protein [Butyricimonas paravirosa]BDF53849.1 PAS domain-containing sensor histidine kinase [Odoribacteraceae bacterium]GKH92788.1 PAS domain-containing sensor histidine kinase [Odoribacteraceae bacterium]GKI00390.1 PAS domain-containing sensor histidine kinase [Odoribacteraceae bacterium]GKI04917.1 PAS domain-containing sensor histidine kinase [Odoribacteraceae bacterium]